MARRNSPHPGIHQNHHDYTDEQRVGGQSLMAAAVGLRNHLIADHVEHGAAGEGQGEGKNRAGDACGKISDEGAGHLHQASQGSNKESASLAHSA